MMGGIMEKQAKKKGTKPMITRFSVYNLARNNVTRKRIKGDDLCLDEFEPVRGS